MTVAAQANLANRLKTNRATRAGGSFYWAHACVDPLRILCPPASNALSDEVARTHISPDEPTMTLKWMTARLKMGTWTQVANRLYHLKK
jgi:hypothetical protein